MKLRILAIETSAPRPSVAILGCTTAISDDPAAILASLFSVANSEGVHQSNVEVIGSSIIAGRQSDSSDSPFKSVSSSLVPEIRHLLHEAELQPDQIELVAVSRGPGAFTGLRIGITAARIFAFSTGFSIVGVDVMSALVYEAIAWNESVNRQVGEVVVGVAINAGRQEIFAQSFRCTGWQMSPINEPAITRPDDWLKSVQPGAILTGSGVSLLDANQFAATENVMVPETRRFPRAETIGKAGFARFLQHGNDDIWKLAPIYSRPSAAEESKAASTRSVRNGDHAISPPH